MTTTQAVTYGLVQGLGEFLPISSSAHLILAPWFFKWQDPGLTFDIGLHLGTLLAVIIYFWKDWLELVIKGFTDGRGREGRLFWYLVIASVPGAIGGLLLEEAAESLFRSPLLIAGALIILGAILHWADGKSAGQAARRTIDLKTSLSIGFSQVLAIIPGVSRSGITITTGLLMGLSREGATRFSFLLSTPIIFGAGILKLPHIISNPSIITLNFLIGMLVSCLTGIASIGFLLRYVQTKSFLPFVLYRLTLGVLIIIVFFIR